MEEVELRFHQLSEPVNIKKFLAKLGLTIEKVQQLHNWRDEVQKV